MNRCSGRSSFPRLGDLRLDEATPGRLQQFFTAISKEHGHGQAKTCRSVLSGMLGMATRVDADPGEPRRTGRSNPPSSVARLHGSRPGLGVRLHRDRAVRFRTSADRRRRSLGVHGAHRLPDRRRPRTAVGQRRFHLKQGHLRRDRGSGSRRRGRQPASREDGCGDSHDLRPHAARSESSNHANATPTSCSRRFGCECGIR